MNFKQSYPKESDTDVPFELDFMRHAQSLANIGVECINSPLSSNGHEQAAHVHGHYDIVITSCLQRAIETLTSSNITYSKHIISDTCREVRAAHCADYMDGEPHIVETTETLQARIQAFLKLLYSAVDELGNFPGRRVLVISHAVFIQVVTNMPDYLHNTEKVRVTLPPRY